MEIEDRAELLTDSDTVVVITILRLFSQRSKCFIFILNAPYSLSSPKPPPSCWNPSLLRLFHRLTRSRLSSRQSHELADQVLANRVVSY
jgi:hypothetical protein